MWKVPRKRQKEWLIPLKRERFVYGDESCMWMWQRSRWFALFDISSDKHVSHVCQQTCLTACMYLSLSDINVRVCLCVSTCAHFYVCVCIYIHLSHSDIRTTGWAQVITAGAKPPSRLSNRHRAGCPPCFTFSDPSSLTSLLRVQLSAS